MAEGGAPARPPQPQPQPRRGPAPIASFDHDYSDESPETKQAIRLPEIREDSSSVAGEGLAPAEQRARSHSTPGALQAPAAPRIDISRASSSSHQDSRDSSPDLALFVGSAPGAGELGFREDGALDLRSSTEELAFLEPAPGERAPLPPAPPPARHHSRKDSQGSEAALLVVSGRTSRLSSVGSQGSAQSALSAYSRVSRLSVASGASRSPSPHRMLLETSFCGPKPIETDPEICAAAVEERILERLGAAPPAPLAPVAPLVPEVTVAPTPLDARDRREVRTEATVERAAPRAPAPRPASAAASAAATTSAPPTIPAQVKSESVQPPTDQEKKQKESKNRARAEQRQARSRERRDPTDHRTKSRSKDIIRIKLKPSEEYEDDDDVDEEESERTQNAGAALKPATLELSGCGGAGRPARPTDLAAEAGAATPSPTDLIADAGDDTPRPTDLAADAAAATPRRARDSRTPSPAGVIVSRKSSFCSLFKSRETVASPESPSDALRRKKSLNDGRSRSRSRDRSAMPTSATKIRGSVLSLFRTPRKSATSPSPSSREGSPSLQPVRQPAPPSERPRRPSERLKYYEDTKEGIIHIPLRTPPDDGSGVARVPEARPASAPSPRAPALTTSSASPAPTTSSSTPVVSVADRTKPTKRTVLPDGSIIIPLHSPTEKTMRADILRPVPSPVEVPAAVKSPEVSRSNVSTPRLSATSTPRGEIASTSSDASLGGNNGPEAAVATNPLPTPVEAALDGTGERSRKRERLFFMTHVGSRDQVFSTQFSITKTPSVTSEISGSIPSFLDIDEGAVRDACAATPMSNGEQKAAGHTGPAVQTGQAGQAGSSGASPQEARDSSESESETGARAGSDAEQRGLVVQESFEELPWVPTTLPQERSLALPMVPVRERGGVAVAPLQRPRPPHHARHQNSLVELPQLPQVPRREPRPAPAPAPDAAPAPPDDKLRIKLPRRPRAGSATAPPRPERTRTHSGSEGVETRPKAEWIDFSEVPEKRKQPTRIQTLPAARDLLFSYVAPEECRCECHARSPEHAGSECDEHAPAS